MKKLLALVLGLAFVFGLVACQETTTTATTAATTTSSTTAGTTGTTTTPTTATTQTTTTTTTVPPLEGASGYFNFKYADSEVKLSLLATVEAYLLSKNVSIPMYANSTFILYSSRVDLFSDSYVYAMGYGNIYSTLTAPDPETTDVYTWRTSATASPSTLNPLNYAGSPDSDVLSLVLGALYGFNFNDTKDGYVLEASMASDTVLVDEYVDEASGKTMATEFKITVKPNIFFYDKAGTKLDADPSTGAIDDIKAADFLYTFKQVLDPLLKQRRYNVFTTTLNVQGALAYYNQTSGAPVSWDTVGFAPVDGDPYSFTVQLASPLTEWDFMYNMGSFIISPVYRPLWETCLSPDGLSTTYGSTEDLFASHGAFILNNWEPEKVVELEKNNEYFEADLYHHTNYRITRVSDANAALLMFNNGELDIVGIPSASYDTYKDNPGLKKVPGATVFRMHVNTMTTEMYAELVASGDVIAGWTLKPILQIPEFREALYYAVNREELAYTVGKIYLPAQYYISDAYAADPITGEIYRETDWGLDILEGMNPSSFGYNTAKAAILYKYALDALVAQGDLDPTVPTTISLEYATFTGATALAIGNALKAQLEAVFNGISGYTNVTFELVVNQIATNNGMGVYYDKMMIGHFDLGFGGISGSTLDPWGLVDVWCSDNGGGLFLMRGFDSAVVDLEWDGVLWSFDALVQSVITGSYVLDGAETTQEIYEAWEAGNSVDVAILTALGEIDDAYYAYNELYFTAEQLVLFNAAYDAAVAAVEDCETVAAVENALAAGLAAMDSVPRKSAALFEAQYAACIATIDGLYEWYYNYYNHATYKLMPGFKAAIYDFVYGDEETYFGIYGDIKEATTPEEVAQLLLDYYAGLESILLEYYKVKYVGLLDAYLAGLVEANYTAENYATIVAVEAFSVALINDAGTRAEVDSAYAFALAYLQAVPVIPAP